MKQFKTIENNWLLSGGGRKAIAASMVLHVLIGLIFFTSPLFKKGVDPQIVSVTFHQMAALTDSAVSAPVAAVRIEKKKAVDHRPALKQQNEVMEEKRTEQAEEKNPVVLSRDVLADERVALKEVPKSSADASKAVSDSADIPSTEGSSKASGMQENHAGKTADARFGEQGAPSFIHREMPVYPTLARRLGKEGRVILKLLIDADGKLRNIEVVEAAGYGFTEASLEAVRKSTYEPGFRNGMKVAMRVLLPVSFRLQ